MGLRMGAVTLLLSLLLAAQPLHSTVVLLPRNRQIPLVLKNPVSPNKDDFSRESAGARASLLPSETAPLPNPTAIKATKLAGRVKTRLRKVDLRNAELEPEPAMTYQPVIGVLSQPGYADSQRVRDRFNATRENNYANLSFFAASYVKFVEAGGARVVPLIYNEPWRHMRKVCDGASQSVNCRSDWDFSFCYNFICTVMAYKRTLGGIRKIGLSAT